MLGSGSFNQAGDTIIEVLLAITVFSLVSLGAITIMNQGTNASQRALEITLVRQQIDAQAEALRAAQQAASVTDSATWSSIATPTDTGRYTETECPTSQPEGSFIMNPYTAQAVGSAWFQDINASTIPYSQVRNEATGIRSYGMWIERQRISAGGAPDAYNFTVNACWYGAGLNTPLRLETLVRLYDPS
jgi:type II secretory pathway pseudopilin PulG